MAFQRLKNTESQAGNASAAADAEALAFSTKDADERARRIP
jgi:hypothetical protein